MSIKEILKNYEYKNWVFDLCEKEGVPLLRITHVSENLSDSFSIPQSYLKWYLHHDISFQDLTQLLFLAISSIEKYILSYEFKYKDVSVFIPHKDPERYIKIENRVVDYRKYKVIRCFSDVEQIVSKVKYRNWEFNLFEEATVPILQIRFKEQDTITGEFEYQYSRKWVFNYGDMGELQVVQTCFLAVSTAVRHENREKFLYNKRWITNPHRSIEMLLEEKNVIDGLN